MDESTKYKNTDASPGAEEDDAYVYRHAGIKERTGFVPLWLILVVVSLLIWSVYYTIRYWSPD
jgi:hypothetical protein